VSRPTSIHRTRPARRRLVVLVASLALGALLASCSWTSGAQYFIHWGPARDDVIIRERTSWDLTLARDLFFNNNDGAAAEMGGFICHANRSSTSAVRCVMRLLHGRTEIPSLTRGVWRRATASDVPVRFRDFNGAFSRVDATADDRLQLSACLTLSVYPHTVNWTERSRSDSNCRVGKHAW
jgi:hypothetical protein